MRNHYRRRRNWFVAVVYGASVPSVVVSLWQVPDESTSDLIIEFYRQLKENPNKAQALRQAMLANLEKYQ